MSLAIFGWGVKAPSKVNNEPAPLLKLVIEKTQEIKNFHTLPSCTLRWMKNVCDFYKLKPEDPFYQKLSSAICKSRTLARSLFREEAEVKEASHQGFETLSEIKERIKKEGSRYTALSLNNLDDELIQILVMACPNLTDLRICPRSDCLLQNFTDNGLKLIPQIKKLARLELNIWESVSVSQQGLSALLSNASLQIGLRELKIMSPAIDDALIPLIVKFSNLEILTIQSCFLTASGLSGLILPAGLKELNLNQSTSMSVTAFNNAVLLRIAKCPLLTSLTIGGDNQVTEEGVISLIKALQNLKHLTWNNFPLSLKVMTHLPSCLSSLSIGELNGLFYINGLQNFLKRASCLTSLTVQNSGFASEDIAHCLPATLKHLVLGTTGLSTLSMLPASLTSLTIEGSTQVTPSQFAELSKLRLSSLRLINCPTLNDDAICELLSGNLAETIETLEIYNASISHFSVPFFTRLPKLSTLMLGECYGIGIGGYEHLLKSPNLRERIKRLYLDGPIIHLDCVELFNYWSSLSVFYIGNMLEYPNTQEALKRLTEIRPIQMKNGIALWWYGEPMDDQFLNPL